MFPRTARTKVRTEREWFANTWHHYRKIPIITSRFCSCELVRNPFVESENTKCYRRIIVNWNFQCSNVRIKALGNFTRFLLGTNKEGTDATTHRVLMQFPTTYLYWTEFSAVGTLKLKRQKDYSIEDEMRVCLPKISPNIKEICKCHQFDVPR